MRIGAVVLLQSDKAIHTKIRHILSSIQALVYGASIIFGVIRHYQHNFHLFFVFFLFQKKSIDIVICTFGQFCRRKVSFIDLMQPNFLARVQCYRQISERRSGRIEQNLNVVAKVEKSISFIFCPQIAFRQKET